MKNLNHPLNDTQRELLKLFARDLPENELLEVKQLLVKWLSAKLDRETEQVWAEKGWTSQHMEDLLRQHLRSESTDSD